MYTFRRPQQQQQHEHCGAAVGVVVEEEVPYQNEDGAPASEFDANVPAQSPDTVPQLQQEKEQQQQTSACQSEEALFEEGLRYCREMILRSQVTSPPSWRRMRVDLPASIAELHLTPSAPENVQQTPPITPSPCVVLQLNNNVPEGMTVKEYSKSLVKYIFDLLAYQRASTAITSLRFVKIGTELSQLVMTFGRDVRLAARVLEELSKVGLRAGFGVPATENACATFQVTDYFLKLHGGSGITAEDVASLLQPTRPPLGISVVPGYEPGVFYAAVQRAETVYAWLWNPFCSFLVQHALFERFGVLVTTANCPHEFVNSSSAPYAVQQQQQPEHSMQIPATRRGRRDHDDDDYDDGDEMNDDRMASNSDGDDNGNTSGDEAHYARLEGRAERGGALAWARNAKDEIDIFEGLNKETYLQRAHLDLVDDDTLTFLQSEKEVKQPKEEQNQHRAYGMGAQPIVSIDQPVVRKTLPALPMQLVQPHAQQQQPPYYNGVAVAGGWQLPPLPTVTVASQVVAKPFLPHGGGTMGEAYTQEGQQGIKYPELVDEDTDHVAPGQVKTDGAVAMMTPISVHQQQHHHHHHHHMQQQPPMVYWNFMEGHVGGGSSLYPFMAVSPYNATTYTPLIHHHHHHHYQQKQQQQQPMGIHEDALPSILGQPVNGNSFQFGGGEDISGMGILASSLPGNMPLPAPVVTAVEACEWADRLVHLVQIAFVSTDDADDTRAEESDAAAPEGAVEIWSSDSPFHQVPCTAVVPRMSAEIEDIMSFIEEHHMGIKMVIESTAVELQEPRKRIVDALLTCSTGKGERQNMEWKQQKRYEEHIPGAEKERSTQLSTLLPYLLTSIEGTELVSAIAERDSTSLLPLLARNVLPFLLDPSVIQSVCVVALRADPSAENPLVHHIIRHLGPLTGWLHAHIQSQAAYAELESEHASSTKATMAKAAVVRRLTSQVGNTIDILLAAMSPEQRTATRAHLDATNGVSMFEKTLQVVVEHQVEGRQQQQQEGGVEDGVVMEQTNGSRPSASLIWGTDGALHRSLLRLYLNANLLSGLEVAKVLFVPQPCLTRDHYYFVIVAFSKSHVSPVLSDETARLCGAFLRLMEQHLLNSNNDVNRLRVLTERDALHLIDTALRALGPGDAYTYLREAYFAGPSLAKRYERVEAKLARSTPPVLLQKQHEHHHIPAAILGASSSYNHYNSDQRQGHQTSADGNSQNDSSGSWQAEWTAAMRNYPQFGEPFTPLPTGWTSALSRSYGHYYFKNVKGAATYKHPTDATEFMAAPQAFLRETGVSITLADVLTYANNRLKESAVASDTPHGDDASCITEERANNWFQDQRVREEALDMATLALLKITYRIGGAIVSTCRRSGHERSGSSGGGGRIGRHHEGSGGRHHYHKNNHHHHSGRHSHKRNRSRSSSSDRLSPEELQRKLEKLSTYPARGHPFPPLPRRWACNLSSSNGLYYFRPPHGNPIYQHPLTRREYRASPQTFVLHRNIRLTAIAVVAQKTVEEVERWMADQRQRDEVLDAAVVRIIPIDYASSPDYDKRGEQEMVGKLENHAEDVGGNGKEEEAEEDVAGAEEEEAAVVLVEDDGGTQCSAVPQRSE